jgi:TonB family protein
MKRAALLGILAALLAPAPRPCSAAPDSARVRVPPPLTSLEGSYRNPKNTAAITFEKITGDFYFVVSTRGWEGVGILSGIEYQGVFRETSASRGTGLGRHVIYLRDDGGLEVHTSYQDSPEEDFVERWHRAKVGEQPLPFERPPEVAPPEPPATPDAPPFGEYVYVDELPQAIDKVRPIYPSMAKEAGVTGVVMVQALVKKDGTVGDTKIVKSIPMLDAAAVAAVRQWRFKPASAGGQPVAVWVAVPIKFPPD